MSRDVRRGDIYWCVDEAGGSIPPIPHPHVVISDDVFNQSRLTTVIVCALTSNLKRATEPGNVLLEPGEGQLERHSVVIVSQLASVPKVGLGTFIGRLADARVDEILAGLRFQQASFSR